MANGKFRLLEAFRRTFGGTVYKHRISTTGNKIGREIFEDLYGHMTSRLYRRHVDRRMGVLSRVGKIHGKDIRRNDSVFGRPPAGATPEVPTGGYSLAEGPVAEPRIGCEVKILAKAQQKQIDRVISDLENFALRMTSLNRKCINVAIIGVNHESNYVGHEGKRTFLGRLRPREALTVTAKIEERLRSRYDEVLVFAFKATNQRPYPFAWLDVAKTELDYGAALTRIGELYQDRFI